MKTIHICHRGPIADWERAEDERPCCPSPCAKLCYAHPVQMHNVFKISAALH
ncbi:hypothetical protein M438DRAFT_342351 [Aureobasidium pullulans EXF-150]|uniref:Uncharacterized protein n=1 Tax=Aureobasidium pullulans EXF-150 TaxID=1043002 RepID=A0A074Y3N3_AURPU|nr:uncharacterized protein M438DRAFT_342351 [Aureobasidium pullulans EXF-150]KEQ88802.1 hypothetical protein M438DRAFT_342351 [Aureobasidium pullulans EXF-150]